MVVFNFPAGDTVLLENQDVTYYDVLRGYEESFGKEEGRKRLRELHGHQPPGRQARELHQTLRGHRGRLARSRDGKVWVNGRAAGAVPGMQYKYVGA